MILKGIVCSFERRLVLCKLQDKVLCPYFGIDKAGKRRLKKLQSTILKLGKLSTKLYRSNRRFNIGHVEVSNTKLVFWDLRGQSGLRSIWESCYEEAYALTFVVDAARPSRFEDSKSALEKRWFLRWS
uniref:ADP-ribosylation factor-related protein 1-like n=1 Tax=Nicotiana sylvestris TaxID=4096 RepID=A0A1U7XG15_NICSY|nr:PREDICTED: ADP-ribosylation factor-related protein 1-like [Nicotiana sylvestris]